MTDVTQEMPLNFYKIQDLFPYSLKALSYRFVFCSCFRDADSLHTKNTVITRLASESF